MKFQEINSFLIILALSILIGFLGTAMYSSPIHQIVFFFMFCTANYLGYCNGAAKARKEKGEKRDFGIFIEIISLIWLDISKTFHIQAKAVGFTLGIIILNSEQRNVSSFIIIFVISCIVTMVACGTSILIGRLIHKE
jgi:hypothetical protein